MDALAIFLCETISNRRLTYLSEWARFTFNLRQLETMPSSEVEEEDPAGLKVELMQHQRQALAWLGWREQQHPPGGILGKL